tara:strand:+ start:541 stop:1263 length:723 start_codon:yes stop_codon:yes gene_type:complete
MKISEMLRSELPEYVVNIPSIENKLSFRPFLVKEEKTLLLVAEEGNEIDVLRTIKNIIMSCYSDLDLNKISMGEAEYLFVKLREKSIGETLELIYTHGIIKTPINLDLRKIKIPKRTDNNQNTFNITENISIKMRELSINDVIREEIKVWTPDQDDYIKMIASMIDTITIKEECLSGTDLSIKDKVDFVESMTEKQFKELVKFADGAPKLSHKMKVQIDTEEKTIEINGLNDFFGLVSLT